MIFIETEGSLRVVTIVSPPFVQKSSQGRIEGFCVDLMNEITAITGNKYNFFLSPNGYGSHINGKWNGMIGEVIKKNADLAITDLTITEKRKEVVEFTESFFEVGVSAIMKKSVADVIESWADLANQTKVIYGTIKGGSTRQFFQTSTDPIVQTMNNYMNSNPDFFVRSVSEGITRVSQGNYVFIGESAAIDYVTSRRCDLTHMKSGWIYDRDYGIAMQKNSPYINSFNTAINQLKVNGKIEELKQKWWKSQCS